MTDTLLINVVRFHRAILVFGTILVAVAGSRVATDPTEWASWGLILSGAMLLVLADIVRDFDYAAKELGRTSMRPDYAGALRDILSIRRTGAIWLLLAGSALLAATGPLTSFLSGLIEA